MSGLLANHIAAVTGAGSGIGRAIAQGYAREGAQVAVLDLNGEAASETAQQILNAGGRAMAFTLDVTDRDACRVMATKVAGEVGNISILVNNAGINRRNAFTGEASAVIKDWEDIIAINLNGTFNVTRLAIPHLKKSQAGVIINMSSVAGRFGYANRSAYSATKWGIVGFTKTLSIELGKFGIRANAILPGSVEGDRIQRVFENRAKASGKSLEQIKKEAMTVQSIKRFVDPRDIAALVIFLASDAAKSISGQMLPIDNDMQQAS